ncbi:hypothetical protein P0F65_18370 [Sphingomonas sp. I4]
MGRHVVQGWSARFKLLKIGNEELHNVRLHFADLALSDTDMLLGADFFVSHRLYVSNLQHRIYFTYTGGRLFDAAAHADATAAMAVQGSAGAGDPTDAEGYSRRGAMYVTQHDLPHAIDDFTKAIVMAPKDPRFPRQRALAYLDQRRPVLAIDDLNTTLILDPGDTQARLIRAGLRLRAGNPAGTITDLDLLDGQLPHEDAARLQMAQLYSGRTPSTTRSGSLTCGWRRTATMRDGERRRTAGAGRGCWRTRIWTARWATATRRCG